MTVFRLFGFPPLVPLSVVRAFLVDVPGGALVLALLVDVPGGVLALLFDVPGGERVFLVAVPVELGEVEESVEPVRSSSYIMDDCVFEVWCSDLGLITAALSLGSVESLAWTSPPNIMDVFEVGSANPRLIGDRVLVGSCCKSSLAAI